MQTSYTVFPATTALPGELADNAQDPDIISYVAGEDLDFGVVVVLSSGKVVKPSATTIGTVVGVVVRRPNTVGGDGYKSGQAVAVLRRGRIYASFNGGTATAFAAANVKHASDDTASNAQHRGKVTASATATTAGAEVSAVSGLKFFAAVSSTVAELEVALS